MTQRPYTQLAEYYDRFFTSHRPAYRRARRTILGPLLPRVRSACELACGTGWTALEFARRGIKVYAVDLSPVMCRIARAKARRAGAPVVVRQGDMPTFRLPEPVDLITSEYDAVNHVLRKSDLMRVARAAARALRPGGYFYFDVNNRAHLEKNWSGASWQERPGVAMVMRGSYDRRRAKGCADFEWFVQDGKRWRRFREHVEEVWWTPAEIRRTLRAAGFQAIRAWDAAPFSQGHPRLPPGCRTFYLARKRLL
ncbi:MAG TPA: class I SAM-dependent methyltransferase [Terriglobia bacterium]|nr:class I SAM-dependent methyltransferase [Terriglobia bacterium]